MTTRKHEKPSKRRRFKDVTTRGKLHVDLTEEQRQTHQYFWANANPARISDLEERGYERVDPKSLKDPLGPQRLVGQSETGDGHQQVLMRLPRELAEEDMADKRDYVGQRLKDIVISGGATEEMSPDSREAFAPGGTPLGYVSEE